MIEVDMETIKIDVVRHWIRGQLSEDPILLTLETLQNYLEEFDVMIREVEDKKYLFLDEKGKSFRTR